MVDSSAIAESALAKAREKVGGPAEIGRAIGVTPQAVSQWRRVPAERVLDVERISGVPRHELRPDLYPAPEATAGEGVQ